MHNFYISNLTLMCAMTEFNILSEQAWQQQTSLPEGFGRLRGRQVLMQGRKEEDGTVVRAVWLS